MFKIKVSIKKFLNHVKGFIFKPWFFLYGDLKDGLTGGDGHLDITKVHEYNDNVSIELWFNNQEKS